MAGNTFDPLNLRAQQQEREDAELAAQLERQVEINDLRWIMSDKRGRRVVARLLDRSGVASTSFSTNALTMAEREGRRSVGLAFRDQVMTHCLERYFEMLKEGMEQ